MYRRHSLFHGDIKPENIFFDKKLFIITSDIGSALYTNAK